MPIGLLADRLIDTGKVSAKNVRRICNSIGHWGSAIGLIGLAYTRCDKTVAIVWLCLSVCLNGAVYSGFQVRLATPMAHTVATHRHIIDCYPDISQDNSLK